MESFEEFRSARIVLDDSGMTTMTIDELTALVISCAIAVHEALGPGLLESVYRDCLAIELRARGLTVELEKRVDIVYRDRTIRNRLRIDILVDGRLVLEVKAVDRIHPVHQAQVITYLKLANLPAGLILNFNAASMRAGIRRVDHPDVYAEKRAARLASRQNKESKDDPAPGNPVADVPPLSGSSAHPTEDKDLPSPLTSCSSVCPSHRRVRTGTHAPQPPEQPKSPECRDTKRVPQPPEPPQSPEPNQQEPTVLRSAPATR
jgi:GxxExxY protein